MNPPVTKARNRSLEPSDTLSRATQRAVMSLESAVIAIMDYPLRTRHGDTDAMLWGRKLKSVAMPVSLALSECRGPRRFHYHYRHKPEKKTVLQPVLEPHPLEMLARVCRRALDDIRAWHGIADPEILDYQRMLDSALRRFLRSYQEK